MMNAMEAFRERDGKYIGILKHIPKAMDVY